MIALLFFSLWSFEKAHLQQMAALSADRVAYNWDNSHKDILTGAYDIHQNDSLYWRVSKDSVGQTSTISIPTALLNGTETGPKQKLLKAIPQLPQGIKGILSFKNRLIDRKVEIQLSRMITPLPFLSQWLGQSRELAARSSSFVAEPVEFIRNTDMALTYLPLLKESIAADEDPTEAIEHGEDDEVIESEVITSEAQASEYIRKLVHGHSVVIDTEETGESRKIDALDPDGIAHEAKYTVNNNQAHQEILKDVELIRKGVIKGAVWHFFRIQRTGQTGLTAALRKDLEAHGILIVIHN